MIFLPEHFKIVDGSAGPVTTNGGVTCDYVSLKDVHMAWIVVNIHNAVTHATVVQPQVATAVAPTGATSITFAANWWKNADVSASDTLSAQTAATSGAFTAGVYNQMIVFQIDPADVVSMGATYDVLGCTVSNSAQATNFVQVTYYLETRYAQATPPTALTD
jgi:hypothetical protein